MWKQHELVILPTNEKGSQSILALHSNKNLLLKCSPTAEFAEGSNGCKQHLYILSDEEIKEGEFDSLLKQGLYFESSNGIKIITKNKVKTPGVYKKIIITTDSSLGYEESIYDPRSKTGGKWITLPKILQSFIEYFISQYNKGNIITKVMVEYEEAEEYDRVYGHENKFPRLKINKDNTINIQLVVLTSEKIIRYCKKYEGTNKYNDVLKAIEFGYQLSLNKDEK